MYHSLISLTEQEKSPFYYTDFMRDGNIYRIFLYRLASYTDFQQENAKECRGIMFDITCEDNIFIVSRPMQKFFNLNENPETMNLDTTEPELVMAKEDGSLISSYMCGYRLCLKSKGSLYSEQAKQAEDLLNSKLYTNFKKQVLRLEESGYTINMEYVSPMNRIVLPYDESSLVVLNVRHRETGAYLQHNQVKEIFGDKAVNSFEYSGNWVENVQSMEEIEGVVAVLKDGTWVKVKCDWYKTRHGAISVKENPYSMVELIINEELDDIRELFINDEIITNRINNFEKYIVDVYNDFYQTVDSFVKENADLTQKEFALKAIHDEKTTKPMFSAIMNIRNKKETSIKAMFLRMTKRIFDRESLIEIYFKD